MPAIYDAANELTNWNGLTISYDANGNMLSDGSNTFAWNARNQVATLNNVSLQYDAFGRRIKNGAGTSFLYNGANDVQELSGSTVTANLLNGGVDEVFTQTDGSGSFAQLKDALGSTIALADGSGNVQTSYTYDPFGATSVSGQTNSNGFQYTGRENEGNGLYYYRARYYSPSLGRFISQDPLGFAGSGPNLYAYVGNSPTNFRDSAGLSRDCFFRICGGISDAQATPHSSSRGEIWRPNWLQCLAMDMIGEAWKVDCMQGPEGPIITVRMSDGQVFTAYGGLITGGSGTVPGYRAVSPAEYQDIVDTGAFNGSPTGSEVKWFFDTPQQAQDFGLRMYGEGNFRVVSGSFSNSVISPIHIGGEGPGFVIPNEELPGIKPEIIIEP